MQGYSTPSLLYDEGFFGRSELNFNENGPGGEPTISSGLLGLSDSLDRLDTASSFGSGSLEQAVGVDATLGGATTPPDSMNGLRGSSHQQNDNIVSGDNHSHHPHGDHHGNPFGVDENGNLVMQDVLHHSQIISNSMGNNNHNHGHGSNVIDHMSTGVSGERSSQGDPRNGVTSQWEESLQDLQSLLALHGQQHSQIANMGLQPIAADHIGPAFTSSSSSIRASGGFGFEKGHAGSTGGGFGHNSKFPAAGGAADSELLSLLHFPRPNSSSLQQAQQQVVQAPAGPVSAFPSNPGFRKGSGGPVNSSSNTQVPSVAGLYSSSGIAQNLSSFPYTAPSLVGSSYFNLNSGGIGNLNSFLNHGNTPVLQKQLMRAPSIIDLEQARDHCNDDNVSGHGAANSSAAKFSSSLFESAKRSGSEGNLLLSGKGGSEPRGINHFATERQRREYLNEKYQTLRSLVPNPSKADRASIVADAIEYVKELKRTVQELQILVQDKRKETSLKEAASHYCTGNKRRRDLDDSNAESSAGRPVADISSSLSRSFSLNNGKSGTIDPLADVCHLRNSWLQRTSQSTGTHVDVRIVHDEVTIKVTQRRRKHGRQLLLQAMVSLYELHLDLQHANGANIGEHDVYVFNTKILEGSSTFAGYVVTKFLEAVDRECTP